MDEKKRVEEEEVVIGEALFSHALKEPQTSLNANPAEFVADAMNRVDYEQDIRGDEELQRRLFERLPIPKEKWREFIDAMKEDAMEEE